VSIGKKNFEAMGRSILKSGDTIKRMLPAPDSIQVLLGQIALKLFAHKKNLILVIDDTLIHKIHSQYMQGSGRFYDTGIGRRVLAFKLLVCGITDGRYFIPLSFAFLFSRELCPNQNPSKDTLVKQMIQNVLTLFSKSLVNIIVAVDGAFATKSFLLWCHEHDIKAEARMHCNRVVYYKGKSVAINAIKELQPKGRYMSRTIAVLWHGIPLYITAQRRIDKHGKESIVYLAATYQAQPNNHVENYKKRWAVEMCFRTIKQHLGLRDCHSRLLDIQSGHVAAVLLGYSILQLSRKTLKFRTPEDSMRHFKQQKVSIAKHRIYRMVQNFGAIHA